MQIITAAQAESVGGSLSLWGWLANQVINNSLGYVARETWAGHVDYAGLAASQGHSYNMVGA